MVGVCRNWRVRYLRAVSVIAATVVAAGCRPTAFEPDTLAESYEIESVEGMPLPFRTAEYSVGLGTCTQYLAFGTARLFEGRFDASFSVLTTCSAASGRPPESRELHHVHGEYVVDNNRVNLAQTVAGTITAKHIVLLRGKAEMHVAVGTTHVVAQLREFVPQ